MDETTPAQMPDDDGVDEIQFSDLRREGLIDFEVFYRHQYPVVGRALAQTLNDPELAQDAVSEAMARAYQRWSTVGKYENPAGWVYRVGLNWGRSRLRRRRRPEAIPRHSDDIALAVVSQLDAALEQLPIKQRSAVVLRYYLDWSERQIAEALNIAPGTVKSRLSRALDRLADLLEDSHGT